jgi:hypothetical protein
MSLGFSRRMEQERQLDGFELDLAGYLCAWELEYDDPRVCPFDPGCGATTYEQCPLMKRRALILLGPEKRQ